MTAHSLTHSLALVREWEPLHPAPRSDGKTTTFSWEGVAAAASSMKLDANVLRYLTKEEFRVLTAVEQGQKNKRLRPSKQTRMRTWRV